MTKNMAHKDPILIVLGMHRSGTSMVAHLFHMLGADFSGPLIEAMPGVNEKGFWEHVELVRINEAILKHFNTAWFDHRILPECWWESDELEKFEKQCLTFLKNEFKERGLIAIKDPRLCRLLPFWTKILQQSDRAVKCVLVLRNPQEVAQSIHTRDHFDTLFCYYLWLTYVLESEFYSRGIQRVVVHYDQILNDREKAVHFISENLQLNWPNSADSVRTAVNQAIDPDLRHHVSTQAALTQDHRIPVMVKSVYRLFRDHPLESVLEQMDSLRNQWHKTIMMANPEVRDIIFRINRRNAEQSIQLHQIHSKYTQAIKCIQDRDNDIILLNNRYQKLLDDVVEKDRQIKVIERQYTEQSIQLHQIHSNYTQAIKCIQDRDNDIILLNNRYQKVLDDVVEKDRQLILWGEKNSEIAGSLCEKDRQIKIIERQYADALLRLDTFERIEKKYTLNPNKIHYHFDMVERISGKVKLRGWLFSEILKIDFAELLIAGYKKEKHLLPIIIDRSDVFEKFRHQHVLHSGFNCIIDTHQPTFSRMSLIIHYENGSTERILIRKIKFRTQNRIIKHVSNVLRQLSKNDFSCGFSFLINGHFKALAKAMARRLSPPPKRTEGMLGNISRSFLSNSFVPRIDETEEIDIIVPVFNGMSFLPKFFDDILNHTRMRYRLIIVDDCSTDQTVFPFLQRIKTRCPYEVILLQNQNNMGFINSANTGYLQTKNHFVILNTDVELPKNWLVRLMAPILNNPLIASTTPFTNAGTICSFPEPLKDNPIFENIDVQKLDAFFLYINPDKLDTSIPTGVGFCMGVNRDVASQIDFFDALSYKRGYGEENDWCMRALKKGYYSVIVPNLFVYHRHGASFMEHEKQMLLSRNLKILLNKYPEYQDMVDAHIAEDKFKGIRDLLQLIITSKMENSELTVIIDHDLGGGANIYREKILMALLEKSHSVFLVTYNFYTDGFALIYFYKNRRIHFNLGAFEEFEVLFNWLSFSTFVINDLVSFPDPLGIIETIQQWRQKYRFSIRVAVHNFFSICPSYNLLNHEGRFCKSIKLSDCKIKFPHNNGEFRIYFRSGAKIDIEVWRNTWRKFLNHADEIICFSNCSANIMLEEYEEIKSKLNVEPHRVDYLEPVKPPPKQKDDPLVIGILGALNHAKGIEIVKEIAERILMKKMGAKIVVIGKTSMEVSNPVVSITGEYTLEQLPDIVVKHGVDIFFIPSIWPETFSYTAEEVMLMNYPLAVFNIGAPAERVRSYDKGMIIDEISPVSALNQIMCWANEIKSNS